MTINLIGTTQLVKAWREDPILNPHQLTHAARMGHRHAVCTAPITAWGDAWPASGQLLGNEARCSMCAQITHRE
ncbi:MAG: hypothetical protein JWM76_3851 [Pseudonocardiales bacterium]|jgi:hypothetical protein|nr:hypothetical protein [Pseudonocardiales bacterium]